jgi:3-oxoacyl-[acyl-carrier protein] reductase
MTAPTSVSVNGSRPRTQEGCAVVTGASRGIGAATARALAADGWPVALVYRSSDDAAREVAQSIAAAGGEAALVRVDVAAPESSERICEAVAELGPVLVLVNNAGVRADGLAPQLSDDDWDVVLGTNLTAAFRLARKVLPSMLRNRFGRIVNVSSVVGLRANAGQANYAAAKAGLIGMTKTMAAEVARRGVTVNAVAPGLIATDMTADVMEGSLADVIPMRRPGTPEEVAACIRFLASDEAGYVTGHTLVVDGGMSA